MVSDITNIRENNDKGHKINSMIHNLWSFRYIVDRLKITLENFSIKLKLRSEVGTSSRCPWCLDKVVKYKRQIKCFSCGRIAHGDVVDVLNIALLHGEGFSRVMAHSLLLRVDNVLESKSSMWMQMRMKPLEARIYRL